MLYSPPQSPDLSPIEDVWDPLAQTVDHATSKSEESLKKALTKTWSEITLAETENSVVSMSRRLKVVH
ncbi:hypothetical protein Trydic_g23896 [Trypoxylus dichotomus]